MLYEQRGRIRNTTRNGFLRDDSWTFKTRIQDATSYERSFITLTLVLSRLVS